MHAAETSVDDEVHVSGRADELPRRAGVRSSMASPIVVQERRWGAMVATLVAQSGSPSVVFEAVTREVGLLCDAGQR